jgi:protein-tyrosine phosphatase
MMKPFYSRSIDFEAVSGFRDLGGYPAKDGRMVAWRRLFRSGELRRMTDNDLQKFKKEIGIAAVIDLRHARDGIAQQQEINLLNQVGAKYFYVPLNTNADRSKERVQYQNYSHMGLVYLSRLRHQEYGRRIIEALEIIAQPDNHPLVFHCVAGKDRSGVLAAFVLSVLGVADKDIIEDYSFSAQHMKALFERMSKDPNISEDILNLPAYTWEAAPESMEWFLSNLKREYGSAREYLEIQGAEKSLFGKLEQALLV